MEKKKEEFFDSVYKVMKLYKNLEAVAIEFSGALVDAECVGLDLAPFDGVEEKWSDLTAALEEIKNWRENKT